MGESGIQYVHYSWGPWRGCSKVSAGCDNCYAEREMTRYGHDPRKIVRAAEKSFFAPLQKNRQKQWSWPAGSRVFVCPWGDFFHPAADNWRREAWQVISQRPDLTFIIPTKRVERLQWCLYDDGLMASGEARQNVWLLASIETQEMYDLRAARLLALRQLGPWPVLGFSMEPLLEFVDLNKGAVYVRTASGVIIDERPDWIVAGGETGQGARLMHPDWVRDIRDQCVIGDVPFWLKSWGEWWPAGKRLVENCRMVMFGGECMYHLGRDKSGNELDGQYWEQLPEVSQ